MNCLRPVFLLQLLLAVTAQPIAYGDANLKPDRDWATEFGRQPLSIELHSGPRSTRAELLDLQGGELEIRPGDARSPDERIYIPLAEIREFKLLTIPGPAMDQTLNRLRRAEPPDTAEERDLLRRYLWPMVKFLELPEEHFNGHPMVNDYLQALIGDGLLDEAYAMILEIPLQRVNPVFTQHALDLAEKLVAAQQNERGLALLGLAPMDPDNRNLLELLMKYADDFREQQNFDEALILYQRLRQAPRAHTYQTALLWTAYCHVRLGRIESARLFLREAHPIEPRDPAFSLHQLVLARIALREEAYREAMAEVSQGIVFSRIGYPWVPELLYVTARCYEALGNTGTARAVQDQLRLFFPQHAWARKTLDPGTDETPATGDS